MAIKNGVMNTYRKLVKPPNNIIPKPLNQTNENLPHKRPTEEGDFDY